MSWMHDELTVFLLVFFFRADDYQLQKAEDSDTLGMQKVLVQTVLLLSCAGCADFKNESPTTGPTCDKLILCCYNYHYSVWHLLHVVIEYRRWQTTGPSDGSIYRSCWSVVGHLLTVILSQAVR